MSYYFKLLKQLREQQQGAKLDYTPQFLLRGSTRNANNTDALAMRIADPLWMLGRQWQFGEFIGEDNGSPIQANVQYRKEQVANYSTNGSPLTLDSTPLEARVEAVNIEPLDLKSKVRIGQQYERLIKAAFPTPTAKAWINNLRADLPLTHEKWEAHDFTNANRQDEKSYRFFKLMHGKVLDGNSLLNALADDYPKPVDSIHDYSALQVVSTKFKQWYENLYVKQPEDNPAWKPKQLVHEFHLHTPNDDAILSAPDYQSGHLDWYSFDTAKVTLNPSDRLEQTTDLQPVNVSFAGMPDKRLFSFEDSKIDLSMMDVKKGDLLKMMLLDFSLVSGSDWYTIPLEMQLGELCWIDNIEVKDVFGVTTTIRNSAKTGSILANGNPMKVWDMFKVRNHNPSGYDPRQHFLFLAPTAMHRLESAPVEELLFLRDEYANMVWAIEQRVPNAMGNPMDAYDLHLELYGPFLPPDDIQARRDLPKFRLANTVPSNWIPYLPNHIDGSNKEIALCRAYMLRNEAANEPTDIAPLSYLATEDLEKIYEEAIPKAGVRIQLTKQRMRWTDGNTYVWMGRKVAVGKGEGNSGLQFDYLKD